MKTAIDSSVLLDVLSGDPIFGPGSREALRVAFNGGPLVACDIVWAEVRAYYNSDEAFSTVVEKLGVRFEPLSPQAAMLAGQLWQEYRQRVRGARTRIVADYLVGAHARLQADGLLTRDRGFYRDYFQGLTVLDPTRS